MSLDSTLVSPAHPHSSFTALERDGDRSQPGTLLATETTGLGGVGIVPFLIGCGSVVEEDLRCGSTYPGLLDQAARR
ncbi:MAG: hypothetical protein IPH75_11200 [bacterium]|nr:hypothetical protein [bacterium]